ncbi:ROK family transcriptional regulator [Hoeflea poritis]|uniref:ROK family transcriptional regulator n=1 Tax=Hoeflea poritis TaxID=2993659 RepID=A0ABT4VV37_9HYPH|nr:ROK family transcriptional regulator [Hoeflea poritis]MDA4848569.1 ROK family transcriptional regulator [Hoeflea poritis]
MNAVSVRSYNERLVLSLLLQNEGLSRMEIGQRTGLSAQTVSVLVRSMEQEGLVSKGEAQKGRIGPPTIPLSLNPQGAFSVGISLGHHQTDVVLIDFVGTVRFHTTIENPHPDENTNHSDFLTTVQAAVDALPKSNRERIAGIGLALPEDHHELELVPNGTIERYESLREEIESAIGIEVYVQNDITAAAAGESMFGAAKPLTDYLFFYLGARLHNRLVLNHQIFNGQMRRSYDVGLLNLQNRLEGTDNPTAPIWNQVGSWPDLGHAEIEWRKECVDQLNQSLEALSQFVPVTTVVLSSQAPKGICKQVIGELMNLNPNVTALAGDLEISPKAIGAASLPFSSKFTVQ